ncbi:hypothetical protein DC347_13145 [Pseudarthrobacter sp. AG30]|uniref:SHOCT domain-containing protein n=1 Tax=unclassified Pseudarthrobacter TaxID=2647000 RepID=UPI000D64DD9A|nr:hypothetical protein [Pseudarthrobacter sp. AG30]RAX16259.1 hypothetical protein DC347_13145 [Pseudarthrobacter sp. AG30]
MMFWDGSMGTWGYVMMVVSFVLFWGAIISALVILARSTSGGGRRYDSGGSAVSRAGLAETLLAERFARGEIDESEYAARLTVLRRKP